MLIVQASGTNCTLIHMQIHVQKKTRNSDGKKTNKDNRF